MQEQELNRLYQKILADEASSEEKKLFYSYIDKNPKEKKIFERLFTIWKIRIPEETLINSEEKLEEVWKKGVEKKNRGFFGSITTDTIFFTIQIAATFLVIGVLTYLFMVKVMNYPRPIEPQKNIVQSVLVKNPSGQQQKVFLPDGTVVWLNAESQLTYPSEFTLNMRDVSLVGEGYFEVATDSLHPFVVTTDNLSVTVYGTCFNVKSNPKEEWSQVSLVKGSVAVKSQDISKKLEPGWCYKYNTLTKKYKTVQFDKEKVMAWKEGILIFEEDNLKETISKLEKWYGVKFTIEGAPNKDWKLNARFDNENIKAVMENLSFTRDFSYTLKGNRITIFFN